MLKSATFCAILGKPKSSFLRIYYIFNWARCSSNSIPNAAIFPWYGFIIIAIDVSKLQLQDPAKELNFNIFWELEQNVAFDQLRI